MAESFDKIVYSFVMEDVLKGLFIFVPPGYVACVYDLGKGVLKRYLLQDCILKFHFGKKLNYSIFKPWNMDLIKILIQ